MTIILHFQIKAKPLTFEEVLLVSNVHCEKIPTRSQRNEPEIQEGSVKTSKANGSQTRMFSAHVKWTYPSGGKKLVHIFVEHIDEDDKIQKRLIGQTRSCNYVVPHGLLDKLDPPVHLEIMPVVYNPWQTVVGPYRILIKDVKRH